LAFALCAGNSPENSMTKKNFEPIPRKTLLGQLQENEEKISYKFPLKISISKTRTRAEQHKKMKYNQNKVSNYMKNKQVRK
jgi:hypothetical protein